MSEFVYKLAANHLNEKGWANASDSPVGPNDQHEEVEDPRKQLWMLYATTEWIEFEEACKIQYEKERQEREGGIWDDSNNE